MNTDTNNSNTITLKNGRQVSYTDTGPSTGRTVLFVHGSGSSCDGLDLAGRIAPKGGRLISAARPGIGASSPDPNRSLSSWPADIEELTDQLGVDTFAVLGISGGAPYAAAIAHALPGHVTELAMLSCGGPFDVDNAFDGMARANRMIWRLAERYPRLLRLLLNQQSKQVRRSPAAVTKSLTRGLTGPDKAAIDALTPEARERFFVEPLAEALQHGPAGLALDMAILRRPWDFAAGEIRVPTRLWHGAADTSAPVAMARWLADAIGPCDSHVVEGGGHLSVILEHLDESIEWLLAT